jgi:hypothetical protein
MSEFERVVREVESLLDGTGKIHLIRSTMNSLIKEADVACFEDNMSSENVLILIFDGDAIKIKVKDNVFEIFQIIIGGVICYQNDQDSIVTLLTLL